MLHVPVLHGGLTADGLFTHVRIACMFALIHIVVRRCIPVLVHDVSQVIEGSQPSRVFTQWLDWPSPQSCMHALQGEPEQSERLLEEGSEGP
jgi:hypothetical protein